ncbi:MAG: VWA domain-containing protein [Planctomycetia bacterium]|nr:VWA domain-containing protein [Planctomycetia bacterium]
MKLLKTFVLAMTMTTMIGSAVLANQCKLDVSTPKPVLKADQKQTTFIKVGVTGFEMKSEKERTPLNIAIVLDRSGSMSGEKIRQAKEAAICAVEQLTADDIVSVVVYSSDVEVLVPATKLTDRETILKKINSIEASGSTALYDGTKTGSKEVEKFFDKNRVNRVVLLSDGLANVGPSSVSELQELGQEIGSKGISVTTFGLGEGFNEDLMTQLAAASDGNHIFITKSSNLIDVFKEEFQFAAAVVAQEVACKLVLDEGIRPIRVLNMDADIQGQNVEFQWNQIYSGLERYMILEIEVPSGKKGESKKLGTAFLTYANMETNATDELSATASVRFSDSEALIEESINKETLELCVIQVANLENQRATELRDQGQIEQAQAVLNSNVSYIRGMGAMMGGSYEEKLESIASRNSIQAEELSSDSNWKESRKKMRAYQNFDSMQAPSSVPVR